MKVASRAQSKCCESEAFIVQIMTLPDRFRTNYLLCLRCQRKYWRNYREEIRRSDKISKRFNRSTEDAKVLDAILQFL